MTGRIAILGGTFDPIHFGHLAIAEDVRVALQAARVLFVPTAQQPFKTGVRNAEARHRLAMVQLAVADNPHFAVSAIEIQRGGISYTVETVAQLREYYPGDALCFIVGADAAADLHRWFDVERLLQLCQIAVVERPGYTLDLPALYAMLPAARGRIIPLAGPAFNISATELRERLVRGQPIRYHVPSAVRHYIEQHGVYGKVDPR